MKLRLISLALLTAAVAGGTLPANAQRVRPGPTVEKQKSLMQEQAPDQVPAVAPRAAPSGNVGSRIIAVVNDNVISSTDLNARIAMALLSSGLPDTPDVREHIAIQVLHSMVDELLELQEARKNDITVGQEEINVAMAKIAQENNIPGGDMKAFLLSRGIPPDVLAAQIRAGLAWSKVIQRELRPRVDIGDDEVDAILERARANAGKQEFQVTEIFLAVDNPKDDDQVHQFADSLVQQLRHGGNFGAIARQFSQNANASSGGDIGWIGENQLPTDLNKALLALNTGEITKPIRTSSGYTILGLRDKRTISLGDFKDTSAHIQQVYRPFKGAPGKQQLLAEANKLRSTITGCTDIKGKIEKDFPNWKFQDMGDVKLSGAPAWLADQARTQAIGKPSDAMAINNGAVILYVCSRKDAEGSVARETITNQIGSEKLELQARGLLRNLRRDAYLDIRLPKTAM